MNAVIASQAKNTLWRRMRAWIASCVLYIQHLRWQARKHYERAAGEFLSLAKRAIVEFVAFANRIQDSGSWRTVAASWDEYSRRTWGISASHISHLRGAAPYAKAILEAGHETPIIEGHIRKMRKYVPVDSPLIAQTYALGGKVALALNQAPSGGIYRRSLEVLQTAADTGGLVQVGDTTLFIRDEASAVEAVKTVLKAVRDTALEGNSKTKIPVRAIRQKGGLWKLEAETELPDSISFNLYI